MLNPPAKVASVTVPFLPSASTAVLYDDGSFWMVITRYPFHHFPERLLAWKERVRVGQPGGTVLVADVAFPGGKATAYDEFERLRDPSHTRALTLGAFAELARQVGLRQVRTVFFRLGMELEKLLESSFPEVGSGERLRKTQRDDVGKDRMGFATHEREREIWISFPTLAVAGAKIALLPRRKQADLLKKEVGPGVKGGKSANSGTENQGKRAV